MKIFQTKVFSLLIPLLLTSTASFYFSDALADVVAQVQGPSVQASASSSEATEDLSTKINRYIYNGRPNYNQDCNCNRMKNNNYPY